MSMQSTQALGRERESAALPLRAGRELDHARRVETRTERAEALQQKGRAMIFGGFAITILGVILYCAVCFAGSVSADVGDILLRNADPLALGTLAVLGVGTLVWVAGSFTFLRGAMDADEESDDEGSRKS